jgi:hypothetical protein
MTAGYLSFYCAINIVIDDSESGLTVAGFTSNKNAARSDAPYPHEDAHENAARFDAPYPHKVASFAGFARPRHIVITVVESLRADAWSSHDMPIVTSFVRNMANCQVSKHGHYASGQATESNLFALLFGEHPTDELLKAREHSKHVCTSTPLLMLKRAGYKIIAYGYNEALASNYSFRLNRAAPYMFGQYCIDEWLSARWHLPKTLLAQRFNDSNQGSLADVLARYSDPSEQPVAIISMFGATHTPYWHDAGLKRLVNPEASLSEATLLSALSMKARDNKALRVWNRYRNSVRDADRLLGGELANMAQRFKSDTILAVVGDHGESFWENTRGVFGHGGIHLKDGMCTEEVVLHVPLMICLPDARNTSGVQRSDKPMPRQITGQVDVLPTILHSMGVMLNSSIGRGADTKVVQASQREAARMLANIGIHGASVFRVTRTPFQDAAWSFGYGGEVVMTTSSYRVVAIAARCAWQPSSNSQGSSKSYRCSQDRFKNILIMRLTAATKEISRNGASNMSGGPALRRYCIEMREKDSNRTALVMPHIYRQIDALNKMVQVSVALQPPLP